MIDDYDHLDLADLRVQNVTRRDRWHGPGTEPWTIADWSNAMCGEAGEAANVVKKIRRHETGLGRNAYNTLERSHNRQMKQHAPKRKAVGRREWLHQERARVEAELAAISGKTRFWQFAERRRRKALRRTLQKRAMELRVHEDLMQTSDPFRRACKGIMPTPARKRLAAITQRRIARLDQHLIAQFDQRQENR